MSTMLSEPAVRVLPEKTHCPTHDFWYVATSPCPFCANAQK